jgi:hypothetical protein
MSKHELEQEVADTLREYLAVLDLQRMNIEEINRLTGSNLTTPDADWSKRSAVLQALIAFGHATEVEFEEFFGIGPSS